VLFDSSPPTPLKIFKINHHLNQTALTAVPRKKGGGGSRDGAILRKVLQIILIDIKKYSFWR